MTVTLSDRVKSSLLFVEPYIYVQYTLMVQSSRSIFLPTVQGMLFPHKHRLIQLSLKHNDCFPYRDCSTNPHEGIEKRVKELGDLFSLKYTQVRVNSVICTDRKFQSILSFMVSVLSTRFFWLSSTFYSLLLKGLIHLAQPKSLQIIVGSWQLRCTIR